MPQLSLYLILGLVCSNLLTGVLWRSAAHDLTELHLRAQVAQEQADAKVTRQKQITEETAHGWKAALDVTRADWSERLRRARAAQMPGLSQTPARLDDLPADAVPLAAECAATTLMLVQLQGWILKQEENK